MTRVLLGADGSMTRLLEALVEQPLALDLVDQRVTTAAALSPEIRAVLDCADGDGVVIRRSWLVTAEGAAISRNHVVVVDRDAELTALLTDAGRPIGHSLAAAGRPLTRTVLGGGVTGWPAGAGTAVPCAFKESVLRDGAARAVAHLHERFNPAVVPVRESR